ncbi:FlgD immunoglobulin-like domain containing protein [Treponema sp.]|uniref:FlgD immunoglobulin-like domain containing protein n=1 Tax=Treponema sp. TaxID=166 RepID=UPI00298DB393|nr:FlgD immunoglobulin-like domain containing protein [Treponema sp.]MCQ2240722.1 OmpA family protein [Treponema sp.]
MKKTTIRIIEISALAAFVFAGTQMFAAPKDAPKKGPSVKYISPNNDGIMDELTVNFNIDTKAKNSTTGIITAWNLRVYDKNEKLVRTIGNKIKFPEEINAKSLLKQLGKTKESVDIPPSVSWNGYLDDGSLAEDGTYYYSIWTRKGNGQETETKKATVIVDNTPPAIELAKLSSDEKNFGEGAKAVLPVNQSGSVEELWTAKITDMNGNTVKSYRWEKAAPDKIVWNGTNDSKAIVPDGVYQYEITSTDLAGNTSEKAVISNIIFSAEKPEISISIAGNTLDSRFFAPAPKGEVAKERKTVNFDISIPSPKASVNSLVSWKIDVVGKSDDNVLYTLSGNNNKAPDKLAFDGKGSNGAILAEGEYRAKVTARYLNGYEPKAVYSPVFVLDNEAPTAVVNLPANTVFNGQNLFEIVQQAASENSYTGPKNWVGKIVDKDGKIARQYNFGSILPAKVEWNGLGENGQFNDNTYRYILEVTELAGNKRTVSTSEFTLDTSKTELAINVAPKAFSLNAESKVQKVSINPVVNASSGIKSYEVAVSSKGTVVKKFTGSGKVPSAIQWDGLSDSGTRCADGEYVAKITTVANSGTEASAESGKFILDSTAPVIKVSVPYVAFSPEETSTKKNLPVMVEESSVEELWTAEIRDGKNAVVKTVRFVNSKAANFSWDGTDDNGNKVANGNYSLVISSVDAAGNKGQASISGIAVDARPVSAYVTAEYNGISPNGDNVLDVQKFDIKTTLKDGIASWKFDIVDEKSRSVKQFSDKDQKDLPAVINWAGDTNEGTLAEGIFKGKLHVEYTKGNIVDTETSMFICTTKGPELAVRTAPAYFSPDNDGNDDDLFIQLKCKAIAGLKNWSFTIYNPIKDEKKPLSPFWKTAGKNVMTERLVWDGRGNNGEIVQSAEDYPYILEAYDELGMHTTFKGVINVDVLIIQDGDKLKMQIPSIIFRANAADFGVQKLDAKGNVKEKGITQAQADNNQRILKRVAEILNKFKDYRVTVVGHANRVTDNADEETKELIPLSTERAEYVKNQLIALKVKDGEKRLSSEGKGGTEPVADRKNSDVNWKNRRVEFILQK